MNTPGAARSAAYDTFHPRIRQWIHRQGWRRLHEAQEYAAPLILGAEHDVIVAAATAAGKTEAAWFPICSTLLADTEARRDQAGVKALCIAPLKALINDQYGRLGALGESLGIPVHRWHGDVAASQKAALRRAPDGLLLTTPESLEALFVRSGTRVGALLGGLRYVVIDEFHSFLGTERGAQVQSLLHRVELVLRRQVPRIALSATLGDFTAAAEFLRPRHGPGVQVVHGSGDDRELRLQLRGYRTPDPGTRTTRPDTNPDPAGEPERHDKAAIADHLFTALRGSDNLVFAGSRTAVEEYTDLLDRRCAAHGVPRTFLPHHGNLSKDLREFTEARLKDRSAPVTAICTSTLEMGIDIGSVRSVAQIGAPPAVAALRQRLGRSGRQDGDPSILRLYVAEPTITDRTPPPDQLRGELVQTIAMVDLMLDRWYEPPDTSALHLSTLIQQILSVIAQRGGARAETLHSALCASGPFTAVDRGKFVALLRSMAATDLLMQAGDGLLLPGTVGERLVNHYDFYSAFPSPEEYRLVSGGRALGTLPIDFPVTTGTLLIFGGRRWRVLDVDTQQKLIDLTPSSGGTPPHFSSSGAEVADPVRQRMHDLYEGRELPRYLDQTAQDLLDEGRATYARMRLAETPIVAWGQDTLVFPFRGDRIMNTLAVLLTRHDLDVGHDSLALTVRGTTAHGLWRLLADLATQPLPDPVELAASVQNATVDKHDHHLSPELLQRSYAARALDVPGAWEALGQLADSAPPTACGSNIDHTPAPQAPELAHVELGRTPFAVVDVATTGLYPQDRDRIVEIAIVHTSPHGTIEDVWSTLLEPDRDPGPTRLHGLTLGDLAGAPRFTDIAAEITDRLAGRVVVAHGSDFDLGFLVAEFTRAGLTPPLWPVLCTRTNAQRVDVAADRLDRVCAADNIELTNRFEPVPAATATAQLLANLLARAAAADLELDDLGCQPLELPPVPARGRRGNNVPARPRAPRVDVARATAAMRESHVHGDTGFAARVRSAPTGTAAEDAYLDVLDRCLADGVLTDNDIATLRSAASAWNLSSTDLDALHRTYIAVLHPSMRAVTEGDLGPRLELVARP